MAGINPYSLNNANNTFTPEQNPMMGNGNPFAPLTSSYSTLQSQQAIQNNGRMVGNTGGLISNQMRLNPASTGQAIQSAAPKARPVRQGQSGLQMQPQMGIQPGQASANASPKMTVY